MDAVNNARQDKVVRMVCPKCYGHIDRDARCTGMFSVRERDVPGFAMVLLKLRFQEVGDEYHGNNQQ